MGTTSLTAAEVLDKVASLQNDTAKTTYTYTATLPYLQMALDELQENFELNNIPITSETSAAVTVNVGVTSINPVDGIGAGAAPNYPTDLVEIQGLYERLSGSLDPYIQMTRKDYLPHDFEVTPISSLVFWAFEGQKIVLIGATTPRQVRIDYVAAIFSTLIDQNTVIGIINARSFLQYRTAALCSQFIGENKTRADELNLSAGGALDRVLMMGTKGRQAVQVRRRPFMNAYKRKVYV